MLSPSVRYSSTQVAISTFQFADTSDGLMQLKTIIRLSPGWKCVWKKYKKIVFPRNSRESPREFGEGQIPRREFPPWSRVSPTDLRFVGDVVKRRRECRQFPEHHAERVDVTGASEHIIRARLVVGVGLSEDLRSGPSQRLRHASRLLATYVTAEPAASCAEKVDGHVDQRLPRGPWIGLLPNQQWPAVTLCGLRHCGIAHS